MLAEHARPVPIRLARLAPAETIEVALLGYDARESWHAMKTWLAQELPDLHEEMARHLALLPSTMNIDLERELIGQLSGDFGRLLLPLPAEQRTTFPGVTASLLLGILGPPGPPPPTSTSSVSRTPDWSSAWSRSWWSSGDDSGSVRVEDLFGYELHTFDVPELLLSPSWAFVDGKLVGSLHRSAVCSVLQQASNDSARGWLDEGRSVALRAEGSAVGSSVAHLGGLARVKLGEPLATLLALTEELHQADEAESPGSLETLVDTLPERIEQQLSGTAKTTVSIDGRVLRYWFRTN